MSELKETKEALKFGISFLNALGESLEDGKIGIGATQCQND